MRRFVFVLTIIIGLLIFGCIGGPSETAQPGTAQQPEATAPATGEQPGQPATEQPVQQQEQTQTQEQQQTGEPNLAGLTYMELAALGIPIECDVSYSYQGVTTTMKMYLAGEDKMRTEVPYEGKMMVSIVRGETLYVTNLMADMYPECKWLVLEQTETGVEGETYDTTSQLEDVPAPDFDCRPWVYDDSKFTVPAEDVCTQEEFNALISQQYGIPDYQ